MDDIVLTGCTIVAGNYLALARVLSQSFLKHHPGARFVVLVVDDTPVEQFDDSVAIWRLHDLGQPMENLHEMAGIYDVMEFCTAVKPWLLMRLVGDADTELVVYLDPDIEVYAPIEDVVLPATTKAMVVTPHVLTPMPRDSMRPNEADVLGSGVYNLGFLAVGCRAKSEGFLEFWAQRVLRDAIIDQPKMLFTDQRWVDFVPMFPHVVCADEGCNVAYWNVWGREVTQDSDGTWMAGANVLRFFHFSGFDPRAPQWLSSHQGDRPRVRLPEHPGLAALCHGYAQRLLESGHLERRLDPYGWATTRSGLHLTKAMRRAYRAGLVEAEAHGKPKPPGPYAEDGGVGFQEWLCTAVVPGGISHIVHGQWLVQPGLQALFDDPFGSMAPSLNDYVRAHFDPDVAPESLMKRAQHVSPVAFPEPMLGAIADDPQLGVNLVGFFDSMLSVGQVARSIADGLGAVGVPHGVVNANAGIGARVDREGRLLTRTWDYDVNLLVVNADRTVATRHALGSAAFSHRVTAVQWAWETAQFSSSMVDMLDLVDEVWALSTFVADAVTRAGGRARVITLPVEIPRWRTAQSRADLGLPEGFLVMQVFDWASVAARKNPLGALDAYCRAFSPKDGAHLVFKTLNADHAPRDVDALLLAASERPDVHVVDRPLRAFDLTASLQHADCVLSLHRSEGLGMVLAEAMACGTPCVATKFSGNLDFMDETNALLVPATLVDIGREVPIYGGLGQWAEPDIDYAAHALRQLFVDRELSHTLSRRAQDHIERTMNLAVAGRSIAAAVAKIRARHKETL